MKVYDSLVTQMDEGRIAALLDWNHATYNESTGFVTVPVRNDSSDEYYGIIEAMTIHYGIDPDRITKADISLTISTVSGALYFIVDTGIACKKFGCAEMTEEEMSVIGTKVVRFIREQSRQTKTGTVADIIQLPGHMED